MQNDKTTPPVGTGPGSSGIENADMDRDMTQDAETEKDAEAPGNDPRKNEKRDDAQAGKADMEAQHKRL